MLKKIFLLALLISTYFSVSGQTSTNSDDFYVNLLISADKNIYVETEKTDFSGISDKVSEILRNRPFRLDQESVFRIFADENLPLGYIMDVNREMLAASKDKVKTERYLLNTIELNIDGQDWFQEIDLKDLKPAERP
ncbi:hypothetical protein GCM10023115_32370 [Pontixanthobacter gangjinensis]|uniref:Uncharacterized protein n=1 Tax=Christiangramia aestuarii TaxID=1028746 RepID=A0A7K1LNT1_9FLAO|nr:hypothetical protein [Christiangramia aestuarii]MUP42464.1 hypothetical protein [Christiangramia aestuarii]